MKRALDERAHAKLDRRDRECRPPCAICGTVVAFVELFARLEDPTDRFRTAIDLYRVGDFLVAHGRGRAAVRAPFLLDRIIGGSLHPARRYTVRYRPPLDRGLNWGRRGQRIRSDAPVKHAEL